MKTKSQNPKDKIDHVHELLDKGVGRFVCYASYYNFDDESIIEMYAWHRLPSVSHAYMMKLISNLEEGKLIAGTKSVNMGNIHFSEIHRFNKAILKDLYKWSLEFQSAIDEIDGFYLQIHPDDMVEGHTIVMNEPALLN